MSTSKSAANVRRPAEVIYRTRVLPSAHMSCSEPQVEPLSILDASVLTYSPTSAIWIYDAPLSSSDATAALMTPSHLQSSLEKVLDAYPQWAGRLSHAPFDPSKGHRHRYHRPRVSWGTTSDEGVEFIVARSEESILETIPSAEERARARTWSPTVLSSLGLLSANPKVALFDRNSSEGLPALVIQVTTFACGAVSVAARMAHILADASSLIQFFSDWSSINRFPGFTPQPIFDASLVDRAAAGDIDADEVDPALVEKAMRLPHLRYDFWASKEGCPLPMIAGTVIASELQGHPLARDLGRPIPWSSWNPSASVEYQVVHFSGAEVARLQDAAAQKASSDSALQVKISKQDALLAHVWAAVVRARQRANDEEVTLNVTIGVRHRLEPALPENTLGSPLLNVPISTSAGVVVEGREAPRLIRQGLELFNSETISAHLHMLAFDLDPPRYWVAFWGERHTLVTSWLRAGVYDVDFGWDKARFIDPFMPEVDGLVQLMEGGPGCDGSVAVSLHMRAEIMGRILADRQLTEV